ncbi:hypothetical protein NLU13_0286 [Sarocladium strictum]|uniref:Photolyase/cryptochrome alpha/beta domain-containing protein n=1 Tax=Sarocladium strictum TaxID=5046 RepID=A0AA39LB51_SARSR|nr:hypothetical protein NLU13_0286 [Sarocladium strictum]
MSRGKVLVYLIRRDLRVADNPVLHHLTTNSDHGYTHLLPVYVFDPLQIEVSGFLKHGQASPYPEARSAVGGYWRTGPHRAKFIAQSVWDLKQSLEQLNSGLMLRVGSPVEVVKHIIDALKDGSQFVGGVYMTEENSSEEVDEQSSIQEVCKEQAVEFKLWQDEKYFIDDRDTGLEKPKDLPDIFTSYRKMQEPLRDRPRIPLARPEKAKMLPLPDYASETSEDGPFVVPQTQEDCEARLLEPLKDLMVTPPPRPDGVGSAHPFQGGETHGWERIEHLIKAGGMTKYKETRNGLLGPEFSTKLSAYLALGCITARQIHHELLKLEDGKDEKYKSGAGFGQGENEGTRSVRFELLWRDYMRLCTIKFGKRLFHVHGFRQKNRYDRHWKSADKSSAVKGQSPPPEEVAKLLERILTGTTGLGLIDASQRELFHTGYTSNRARQNVASFLAKHLEIDWRYGAEWYEMLLVDYDVSSNWSNWQYVAGVGNDPRGDERNFNPVKQAFDYDKEGAYVRSWVPELKDLERLECVFQVSTAKTRELQVCGLEDNIMVTDPVKRIQFVPNRKPRPSGKQQWRGGWRGSNGKRGGGRGGGGRGGPGGMANGDRTGHQENGDGHSNHANGDSGPGDSNTNGHSTRGGTQHRGGHGGLTRGGESTSDAFWFDEAKSGKADGPSSDDATAQPKYHQDHVQSHIPLTTWHGSDRVSPNFGRGSHHVGRHSDPNLYQTQWTHDSGKQWNPTSWMGNYHQPVPLQSNGQLNGTNYNPAGFNLAPVPTSEFIPMPQPWFMAPQNTISSSVYPVWAEPRSPGVFVPPPGTIMGPVPTIPVTYQPMSQPPPDAILQIPPPRPAHVMQQKQMSVEARPFVPGQSPNSESSPEVIMVHSDATMVMTTSWEPHAFNENILGDAPQMNMGPVVVAHSGGGAW